MLVYQRVSSQLPSLSHSKHRPGAVQCSAAGASFKLAPVREEAPGMPLLYILYMIYNVLAY